VPEDPERRERLLVRALIWAVFESSRNFFETPL